MDGRGGCCIAQYAGGAYDTSKVDRIMLRFRPIAPKPVAGGAVSGSSKLEKNVDSVYKAGRSKRRYVRENNKRCNRKRRVLSEEKKDEDGGSEETSVVTLLPLLPEMPDRKETPVRNNYYSYSAPSDLDLKAAAPTSAISSPVQQNPPPIWLNFNNGPTKRSDREDGYGRMVVMPQPVRPVGSLVTVERVTEGYVDGEEGLGYTDEERRKNLERDTCPGFISDGVNRVEWTNEAYRKMIGEGDEREMREGDLHQIVWLVMKERLPLMYTAFACRVRLQYTCRKERHSLTVPCDVWRMDGGGFAWRLDVKAALCLGR
ncbi:uncharacterized protein LOC122654119 isoform X2 [Telopea speciosissima]|uniref:uncharacterized protein LOC122654119 isoform X1 n=1 Tax=Telopea speciosissima TaxID=54955 RepID=UPI001CC565F8|nr:uncharacterized protein LOC122654119 isoform X1 [Telopea speciosissima]XP_043704035.1 uncharacterized protein LOC122654119 isoform X2 [Telopea speciosissima]